MPYKFIPILFLSVTLSACGGSTLETVQGAAHVFSASANGYAIFSKFEEVEKIVSGITFPNEADELAVSGARENLFNAISLLGRLTDKSSYTEINGRQVLIDQLLSDFSEGIDQLQIGLKVAHGIISKRIESGDHGLSSEDIAVLRAFWTSLVAMSPSAEFLADIKDRKQQAYEAQVAFARQLATMANAFLLARGAK